MTDRLDGHFKMIQSNQRPLPFWLQNPFSTVELRIPGKELALLKKAVVDLAKFSAAEVIKDFFSLGSFSRSEAKQAGTGVYLNGNSLGNTQDVSLEISKIF